MSILTPSGELVFNDLTGSATKLSTVVGPIWPGPNVAPDSAFVAGLPNGNGYLMQFITGSHGAPIRNPVDIRPHKHGGIVHKFYAGPKYVTFTGLVIGDTPKIRRALYDYLSGWLHGAMQADSQFFFTPPGAGTRVTTARLYDAVDIQGPSGLPGDSPSGIAGPKQFVFELVMANPFSYTAAANTKTAAFNGAGVSVPNGGTIETWPTITITGPPTGSTTAWAILLSPDSNPAHATMQLEWSNTSSPLLPGQTVVIDMYKETITDAATGNTLMGGLIISPSDFFPVPAGGAYLFYTGTSSGSPAAASIVVNDAWA